MEKVLGIDTGTNSLGWAIVERTEQGIRLLDKGVHMFQEGVKVEKGIESSKASERTGHKAIRVHYYRLRLRKIRLLKVLSDNHLCPPLSADDLRNWRLHKVYPQSELFMQWQRTDDLQGINPYAYRHRCLTEQLNLNDTSQRYILGRALYHLNQRRGFLSNRKDQTAEDEGKVKEAIAGLTAEMHEQGFEYLGDYFYHLYAKGEKIRCHYTARGEHYLREFHAICQKQQLDEALVRKLEKAIFDQRPLKSQKGQVGRCVFEPRKAKCPSSHPLYEEFRMLSFINNIKIQTPYEDGLRPLNDEERQAISPLFFRKSKANFNFEDIAKRLAGKGGKYGYYKRDHTPYLFNFHMDDSCPGCVVTAQLKAVFGEDWQQGICEVYTSRPGARPKTADQMVSDVWHALFSFDKDEKLEEFAQNHLQMNADDAKRFAAIKLPSDYASLSLKAIRKILPYLRRGLIYSHAAFLANLGEVMPAYEWSNAEMREAAIDRIVDLIDTYHPVTDGPTLEMCIKGFLTDHYGVTSEALRRLYHPSMMETYPKARPTDEGLYQLGSPRISSVRNPMAMRAMFRLRKLVNRLLAEGKIDRETTIRIEFARELNDANKRAALRAYERENSQQREKARKEIIDLYKRECGQTIVPTDTDILKYQLWEEQDHRCLYTGQTIGLTEFIGPQPLYDIEHTVPQSVGGDSTQMNLTLCESRFNRDVKRAQLPSALPNHAEILQRIDAWKQRYEALDKQIRRLKKGGNEDKSAKDNRIQRRHRLTLERNYWRGKYERFTMTEVPEGFSRRQGTDISIISRYARLYLKSVFPRVFPVRGIATSDFRKIWGIQDVYTQKERVNHVHHCIDAIVIACIGPAEYNELAHYYHQHERERWYGDSKASFTKPWPTFVEDIKRVQDEILVAHYTPDNMPKQGRRRIKVGARRVLACGDAARGSLHNDTYYGAIAAGADGQVRYVVRKPLASLKDSDVNNIVDPAVRAIVMQAIADKGSLAKAVAEPIWMNEEKQIPIRKVRCYTPSVTNPLHIRHNRDTSTKEYKRQMHVANDRNYLMAIYIGRDAKGKERREFELVTNLQAAEYFRKSNDKEPYGHSLVPERSKKGYPLVYQLKIGTMVLLYEKTAEEIWEADKMELGRRLYKVRGMSSMVIGGNPYAVINMIHHEEARQSTEFKAKNGAYVCHEPLRAAIRMYHTQILALVEGVDFVIDETGEIKRLR